jgi:hypothetical protein
MTSNLFPLRHTSEKDKQTTQHFPRNDFIPAGINTTTTNLKFRFVACVCNSFPKGVAFVQPETHLISMSTSSRISLNRIFKILDTRHFRTKVQDVSKKSRALLAGRVTNKHKASSCFTGSNLHWETQVTSKCTRVRTNLVPTSAFRTGVGNR